MTKYNLLGNKIRYLYFFQECYGAQVFQTVCSGLQVIPIRLISSLYYYSASSSTLYFFFVHRLPLLWVEKITIFEDNFFLSNTLFFDDIIAHPAPPLVSRSHTRRLGRCLGASCLWIMIVGEIFKCYELSFSYYNMQLPNFHLLHSFQECPVLVSCCRVSFLLFIYIKKVDFVG